MVEEGRKGVLRHVWMTAAIEQAEKSWNEGGIPIGSVLVDAEGVIVARGHNERV